MRTMTDEKTSDQPPADGGPGCLGYIIGIGALFLGANFLLSLPMVGLFIFEEGADDITMAEVLLIGGVAALPGLFFGIGLVAYGWTLIRRSRAKEGETIDAFSGTMGKVNAICGLIFAGGGILMLAGLVIVSFIEENMHVLTGISLAVFFIPLLFWLGSTCWAGLQRNLGSAGTEV